MFVKYGVCLRGRTGGGGVKTLQSKEGILLTSNLADLTVSKRPGTCYQIEIHFAVVNHLYLLFSFVKLVET